MRTTEEYITVNIRHQYFKYFFKTWENDSGSVGGLGGWHTESSVLRFEVNRLFFSNYYHWLLDKIMLAKYKHEYINIKVYLSDS